MRKCKWTIEEIEDLKYMYSTGRFKIKEMQAVLNKSETAVLLKAKELDLVNIRVKRYRESDNTYLCLSCYEWKEKWEFTKSSSSVGVKSECYSCSSIRKKQKRLEDKLLALSQPIKTKEDVNKDPFKQCSFCGEVLAVENFAWKETGIRLQARCKACKNKKNIEYKLNRIEERGY